MFDVIDNSCNIYVILHYRVNGKNDKNEYNNAISKP